MSRRPWTALAYVALVGNGAWAIRDLWTGKSLAALVDLVFALLCLLSIPPLVKEEGAQ